MNEKILFIDDECSILEGIKPLAEAELIQDMRNDIDGVRNAIGRIE